MSAPVVITGAGGRLGAAVTKAFSSAGHQVIYVDRSFKETPDGLHFEADLTDESQVQDLFDQINDQVGSIKGVVQLAGTWAMKPFLETSMDDWQSMMNINVVSTFLCFREGVRQLKRQETPGGRLVAISAGPGVDRGVGQMAPYAAAKASVARIVEAVADEFNGDGITAHGVAPSTILFEDTDEEGVHDHELAELCVTLFGPVGDALSGQVVRAYGSKF